ncbi:hypothetical protein ACFE04_025884 [Oxalis oulophora]
MANSTSGGGVPPGFRFHPTDEELLHYYLKKKVSFQKFDMDVIREVDLNKMEPWELQERCRIGSTPQNEWYFFSHKDRKYPTGSRTNRATSAGFWKATGRDKCIRNSYKKIGMRKTLVFYRGRAPHGQKTDWIMHEYRLEETNDPDQGNLNEDGWVICRVFKKKNLFKLSGNEGFSSDHQQLSHTTSSTNQSPTFMHHARENQYLMRHQQLPFELNKQPSELALQYSHIQNPSQYNTLLQTQTQTLIPTHKPNIVYDNYTTLAPADQACEPAGLEVNVTQHMGVNVNEWAMLDRLVTPHIGNEAKRFEEANEPASSVQQINQLSLRGEMDFWGYDK